MMTIRRFAACRLKSAGLVVALTALAGCTTQDGAPTVSLEQSFPRPTVVAYAATQGVLPRAFAALPSSAGAVMSVRDTNYADGLKQDILLSGTMKGMARNSITLLARTTSLKSLDETVPLVPPSEGSIANEMAVQFPAIAMQVVTRPAANIYGLYGLALGRGASDMHCIYAWQWIDDRRTLNESGLAGPVSVRIRLCKAGETFDSLAAMIDRFTLIGPTLPTVIATPQIASAAPLETPAAVAERPSDAPQSSRKSHRQASGRRRIKKTRIALRNDAPAVSQHAIVPLNDAMLAGAQAPIALSGDLPPQAYLGPRAAKP